MHTMLGNAEALDKMKGIRSQTGRLFAAICGVLLLVHHQLVKVSASSDTSSNCHDWSGNLSSPPLEGFASSLKLNVRTAYGSRKYKASPHVWHRYVLTNFKFDFEFQVSSTAQLVPFRQKNYNLYVIFEGLDKDFERVECGYPLTQNRSTNKVVFAQDVYFNKIPAVSTFPTCGNNWTEPCNENCTKFADSTKCMTRDLVERYGDTECRAMFPSVFFDFIKSERRAEASRSKFCLNHQIMSSAKSWLYVASSLPWDSLMF